MGQAYCVTLCGERGELEPLQIEGMTNLGSDEPLEDFARRVRQHIEISPRIKDTYLMYRTQHPPEHKGTKLDLYYLFSYSAYYEGEWKNGIPHGYGRVIYDDGSIYEGCFNNGIAHCDQALFIMRNGSFYRGQIKHNKANGQGQLSTTKFFYKGKWLNDLPHGKARQIYSQNSYYEGQFQNGVKQGHGYYRWSANEAYQGSFQNNKLSGRGKLQTRDFIYEGMFKNSKMEGFGQYVHKQDKFKYLGEFKDNYPKGKGRIIHEDGAEFNGLFNGFNKRKGLLTLTNGESVPIESDELQSEGSVDNRLKDEAEIVTVKLKSGTAK